jgi:hypothetical protein
VDAPSIAPEALTAAPTLRNWRRVVFFLNLSFDYSLSEIHSSLLFLFIRPSSVRQVSRIYHFILDLDIFKILELQMHFGFFSLVARNAIYFIHSRIVDPD